MPIPLSIIVTHPVTVVLLAVNLTLSLIALKNRERYLRLILHPYSIVKRREFSRLLTSGFIHHDLVHLLINCLMLYFLCGELEVFLSEHAATGHLAFLFIYLFSHLAGALAVTWSNRKDFTYTSAGASGSILGCMMSFMMLAPHSIAFYLPVVGGIQNEFAALLLIVGLIIYKQKYGNELLDNELHFYSALGGIVATFLMFPHLL